MENIMNKILKFPKITTAVLVLITLLFAWQMKKLVIDNDMMKLLPVKHQSYQAKEKIDSLFKNGKLLLTVIHFPGSSVLNTENLSLLKKISSELENLENINKVTSLLNTKYVNSADGTVRIENLADEEKSESEQAEQIKNRLMSWSMYEGFLLSKDLSSAQIVIELKILSPDGRKNTMTEFMKVFFDIKKVLNKYESPACKFYIAGDTAVSVLIVNNVQRDLLVLIPFVIIVLSFVLLLSFRKPAGVLLPQISVLFSLIWTIGLMAVLGVTFKIIAVAIPIIIIAVGSAYGIHFLHSFYHELENAPGDNKQKILQSVFRHTGSPIFLAGLTTIAGFGSLAISDIIMIREFGIFVSVGVACAMLFTYTLIPALLLIFTRTDKPQNSSAGQDIDHKLLEKTHNFCSRHQKPVFIFCILLIILAIAGTALIKVGTPFVNYFSRNSEIRRADAYVNKNFSGTTMLSIMISGIEMTNTAKTAVSDSDFSLPGDTSSAADSVKIQEDDFLLPGETAEIKPGDEKAPGAERKSVKNSRLLSEIEHLQAYITSRHENVRKTISVVEYIKRMHQVMNSENKSFYRVPDNQDIKKNQTPDHLIAQYLLLYSGNLEDVLDNEANPAHTKITILLDNSDYKVLKKLIDDVKKFSRENLEPLGYETYISGEAELMVAINELVTKTQIYTILSSLVAVFVIIAWKYRSLAAGLIGIVPLFMALAVNFGIMGFFGIALDIVTSIVASIAIGIGVDYAIHFLAGASRQIAAEQNFDLAIQKTVLHNGRPIIFNAVSVSAGFAVLFFSSFNIFYYFSMMIILIMFVSSIASIFIIAQLLRWFKPGFLIAGNRNE